MAVMHSPEEAFFDKESHVLLRCRRWMECRRKKRKVRVSILELEDGLLGTKKLSRSLRARSETILLSQGDSLEEEVASAFFDLFNKTRKNVEAINAAMSKFQELS